MGNYYEKGQGGGKFIMLSGAFCGYFLLDLKPSDARMNARGYQTMLENLKVDLPACIRPVYDDGRVFRQHNTAIHSPLFTQ